MKTPLTKASIFAAVLLSGCVVAPADGVYYAYPSAPVGYYGPPVTSHVWIGGTWSSGGHHHYPDWSPGHHSPGRHHWNPGGAHGGHPGGQWRGGGRWHGRR